jgi:hypothetical protein
MDERAEERTHDRGSWRGLEAHPSAHRALNPGLVSPRAAYLHVELDNARGHFLWCGHVGGYQVFRDLDHKSSNDHKQLSRGPLHVVFADVSRLRAAGSGC